MGMGTRPDRGLFKTDSSRDLSEYNVILARRSGIDFKFELKTLK